MKHFIRALKHRNFFLFFSGQSISLVGTWMTQVAMSWLVYRLTASAFLLGLVSFSSQIPVFLFSAFVGVWVDRWNIHRVLVVTQVLAMLQSLMLAFLTLSGKINLIEIIALGFFQGFINAFDMPARHAFVVHMVDDKKDLHNAIAINSLMVNVARLLGPMLAGFVIAAWNEGTCFLIDGVSYIAVIISLLGMRVKKISKMEVSSKILQQLKEGICYAWNFIPIRNILLLLVLFSLMAMPHTVLMPIFAGQIFKGNAHTLGLLLSASGTGAIVGAFLLASKKSVLGLGKVIVITGNLFGVAIILFSFSRNWIFSLFLLALSGLSLIMIVTSSNTILQTVVEDDKRGRVMSLFILALIGMAPFGSLLSGTLAHYLGAPYTLAMDGIFCVIGTLLFARHLPHMRKLVRPIYVEKEILTM